MRGQNGAGRFGGGVQSPACTAGGAIDRRPEGDFGPRQADLAPGLPPPPCGGTAAETADPDSRHRLSRHRRRRPLCAAGRPSPRQGVVRHRAAGDGCNPLGLDPRRQRRCRYRARDLATDPPRRSTPAEYPPHRAAGDPDLAEWSHHRRHTRAARRCRAIYRRAHRRIATADRLRRRRRRRRRRVHWPLRLGRGADARR